MESPTDKDDHQASSAICVISTPNISITFVFEYFYNKYLMACICSQKCVCMYVLACMLCLIQGCDALETRGPCGPWSFLTMEECCRGHRASEFLLDAPHATHAHMKSNKHLRLCQKNTNNAWSRLVCVMFFFLQNACVSGEDANTEAAC